jgi:hypothetical protein
MRPCGTSSPQAPPSRRGRTRRRACSPSGHPAVAAGARAKARRCRRTMGPARCTLCDVGLYVVRVTGCGNVRGMWGLIGLPSSSSAAGAVPALRAASRSRWRRNSSRESFPGAVVCYECVSKALDQHIGIPEAIVTAKAKVSGVTRVKVAEQAVSRPKWISPYLAMNAFQLECINVDFSFFDGRRLI